MNTLSLFIVTVSCIYLVSGQGEESVPCKVKFMGTACPQGRPVCEEDSDCPGVNQVCCYDGCGTACQNKTITVPPTTTTQPQIQPIPSIPESWCPVVPVRYAFCRYSTYTPCHHNNECMVPGMQCCPDVCGKRCKFPMNITHHSQYQQIPSQPIVPSPQSYPYKGECSAQTTYICNRPILYYCQSDVNCMSNQRCCFENCAFVCSRVPVIKSGYCPVSPTITSQMLGCTIQNRCYDDGDCPYNQKCCGGPCGKQCVGPVRQKVGSCGSQNGMFCYAKYDACYKDADCPGTDKCCQSQCGNKCNNPVSIPQQQYTCPPRGPGVQCAVWLNECNIDSDCGNTGRKCCDTGCGNACTRPTSFLYPV